ncbi:MAG: SH3 domain-containing protein [Treponema sp.]|jgi:hypothetical protein|nr:SH3 domain-containing protein [Treponema sp.]
MKKLPRVLVLSLILASCQKTPPVPAPESGEVQAAPVTLYVNAPEGINLRKEPGTQGAKLAVLPVLTALEPLEKSASAVVLGGISGHWLKVKTGDGLTGWVFGGYVSETKDYRAALTGSWWLDNYSLKLRGNGTFTFGLYSGDLAGSGEWTVAENTLVLDGVLGNLKSGELWKAEIPFEFLNPHQLRLPNLPQGMAEPVYTRMADGYYPRKQP